MIVGEYHPGYLYGTVKTHKEGNPLRPIISQIPTPTHSVAKELNNIISPYLPAKYILKSTDDFLNIVRTERPQGTIASLDVVSLFTNVPVNETIDVICNCVYRTDHLAPPLIHEEDLRTLLLACTTESPFRHINGDLYQQVDGVAMGSSLGVTFANFYMAFVENEVMLDESIKPLTYARYIDDCFVVAHDEQHIEALRQAFERKSVLRFTSELGVNSKINFLDVSVDGQGESYITTVYRKPTSCGAYMNAVGDCPERYKRSMMSGLIHRTYKICSSMELFHREIGTLKQLLVNNGYSNRTFDEILNNYLNCKKSTDDCTTVHNIYYKNFMSEAYKTDEKVLKSIIRRYTKCINEGEKLKLNIYYKSRRTKDLIMKNSPKLETLQKVNVVYRYTCPVEDCKLQYYGYTTTTLSRRITMHLQKGAPKQHAFTNHDTLLTREDMVNNTKVIKTVSDVNRLQLTESVYIHDLKPDINKQDTGLARTLQLLGDSTPSAV